MTAHAESAYDMTAAAITGPLRDHRLLVLAVGVMALVAVVYWQSFSRMVPMWSLMNYEHCWLVVPVSLYVLWRKRGTLAGGGIRGSGLGVLLTALLVLVWSVSRAIGVQAAEFFAATSLVFAVFWAIAGTPAARKAAFPLLLLLAAVPVGEILVEPLMNITAGISSALLVASGVPVLREGTFLTLPGGSFEVAEVCSGLRYLLAGGMASLAYAYVTYASFRKRALFVAIAAAALVLANGLRAYIVMYVASATEMRVFGGRDHVYFGMLLFTAMFLLLIWLGERYADARPAAAHARPARGDRGLPLGAAAATLALLLGGPLLQYARAQVQPPALPDVRLPALPGCDGPAEWRDAWSPEFRNADYVHRGAYACGAVEGGVYLAGYLHQEQGKELISSLNRVWPHDWRRYADDRPIALSAEHGRTGAREVLVRAPQRSLLIWYWYRSGDTRTGSAVEVKLRAALYALALRPAGASVAVVALSASPDTPPAELRSAIEPLAQAMLERDAGEVAR